MTGNTAGRAYGPPPWTLAFLAVSGVLLRGSCAKRPGSGGDGAAQAAWLGGLRNAVAGSLRA